VAGMAVVAGPVTTIAVTAAVTAVTAAVTAVTAWRLVCVLVVVHGASGYRGSPRGIAISLDRFVMPILESAAYHHATRLGTRSAVATPRGARFVAGR
jgi:hypothetical protein